MRSTTRLVATAGLVSVLWAGVAGTATAKTINGTEHDDFLFGSNKSDTINTGGGDDRMFGRRGSDRLNSGSRSFGGPGADRITMSGCGVWSVDDGGSGDVINDGGCLNNLIFSADGGTDTIDCGSGPVAIVDVSDVVNGTCTEVTTEGPAASFNVILGTAGPDDDVGTGNEDAMFGRQGADVLDGAGGDDLLFGGAGEDLLLGGTGENTLIDDGGSGDVLVGGDEPDELFSADGGQDRVACGAGPGDEAFVDKIDRVSGCEVVTNQTTFGS